MNLLKSGWNSGFLWLFDITLTFSDSLFNSVSPSTCCALFEVTFSFIFFSLLSKSVFFMKLAISIFLYKFACSNLALKFSAVNLLNSGVLIYLLWSCIFFLATARAVVVAKLLILDILFLTSIILVLGTIVVTKYYIHFYQNHF